MDMMNGETAEPETAQQNGNASEGPAAPPKKMKTARRFKPVRRQVTQSTIGFPYRDLNVGISVAQAMLGAGGVALTTEQLAGVMGLQAGSGNFVVKVMTARTFGLITYAAGKYALTNLGSTVIDNDDKRRRLALAEAFLNVPLYKRTYEEFKGRQLPPPSGLEQAFVRFGVSAKQANPARLAFEKSATIAGFFGAGTDRLIEPIIGGGAPPINKPPINDGGGNGGSGNGWNAANEAAGPDVTGLHPFIQGLLGTLPEPETNWAVEGRAKWLQTAANIFDLIYKGTGDISIVVQSKGAKE
jgi:hypothetical protein